MFQTAHTYDSTCRLGRKAASPYPAGEDDVPPLRAQYFYCSPLPLDDPLSVIPIPTGSETRLAKHPLRPFSAFDNDALEEAWQSFRSSKERKHCKKSDDKKLSHIIKDASPPRATKSANTLSTKDQSHATKESRTSAKDEPETNALGKSVQGSETRAPKEAGTCAKGNFISTGASESGGESRKDARSGKKTNKSSERTSILSTTLADTTYCDLCLDERDRAASGGYPDAGGLPKTSAVPRCCAHIQIELPSGRLDEDIDLRARQRQQHRDKGTTAKKHNHILVNESSQGDGTHDTNPSREPNSATHRAFLKHEHSTGHKAYVQHRRNEHDSDDSDTHPSDHGADKSEKSRPHQQKQHRNERGSDKSDHNGPTDRNKPSKSSERHHRSASLSATSHQLPVQSSGDVSSSASNHGDESGLTGQPFVKLIPRNASPQRGSRPVSSREDQNRKPTVSDSPSRAFTHPDEGRLDDITSIESDTTVDSKVQPIYGCKVRKNSKRHEEVAVGISRLHLVNLPALQMQPIYWSPVHDEAVVTRGTWFYKTSMLPVEVSVANQLEFGFRALRCWSKTWNDELNSAVEVGAAGEEKIAHRVWPKEYPKSRKFKQPHLPDNPYCAAVCFHGEFSAEGSIVPVEKLPVPRVITKKYSNAQVIYKDAQNAFILKPNLQPSAYYGRKPLQKIQKGGIVGIHVVRGFDWKAWNKLHPSKISSSKVALAEHSHVADDVDLPNPYACLACRSQETQARVTDLCLVIHGIGQKLSERVESFHFTHAMNAFRRSITAERGNEAVQRVLRKDLGGVMVLPVNWRSNLSFEETEDNNDVDAEAPNFSLNDITQPTIPAVRSMISDVMLDIPYYMSQHKPKMIEAVIREANRVYKLWCDKNPDFDRHGRVHIIAHSLGSVMAAEILSKQPTRLPKLSLHTKHSSTKHFNFQTTNLFFAGSPAGFFFYLEKSKMLPRRFLSKPGAEHQDERDKKITGEAGIFGCMAVHNIYNIMHYNDPIAYRLNATVDPQYAASLKPARVPSATGGFFGTISNALKAITPGASSSDVVEPSKPGGVVELEVHDFTREELAEKKFFLLNDNGQLDWSLSSGGGPLELQYINMLGAHSSYWTSPDFVRFIVTEVGRQAGKDFTVPSMRASKLGHKAS